MIYIYCLLTVIIELAWLALWGYRNRYEITIIVCANVVSNLTLNSVIIGIFHGSQGLLLLPMELLVILFEYLVYAVAFGRSRRLFVLTVGANAVSYLIGILLFGV